MTHQIGIHHERHYEFEPELRDKAAAARGIKLIDLVQVLKDDEAYGEVWNAELPVDMVDELENNGYFECWLGGTRTDENEDPALMSIHFDAEMP